MKCSSIVVLLLTVSFQLFGQVADTASVSGKSLPPSPEVLPQAVTPSETRPKSFLVSTAPSAQELADLFVRTAGNEIDPFELVGEVSSKGENAVEGLTGLLFSDTIRGNVIRTPGDTSQFATDQPRPNKLYAALCLRAIATGSAYSALFRAAAFHNDKNVEGLSLQTVATDYLHKAQSEELEPSKEVIHLLLRATTSNARTEFLKCGIREIALNGLKSWGGDNLMQTLTGADDVEEWWHNNQDRVTWNKEKAIFEVR